VSGRIGDILPAVAAVLGTPGGEDRLGLAERIGPVDRVVVVLVDGLGRHLLPAAAPHAPLLADVLAGRAGTLDALHCDFPSTTPVSLVSFGTGARPGEHGVLGFSLRVPGPTDVVLNHLLWRDDPSPALWQPVPTWFERWAGAGVDARALLPAAFLGSGLTEAAYRGARFLPLADGDDLAARLLAELSAGPGVVYGYTPLVDTAAHRFGNASPEWADAVTRVDRLLTRVASELPPGAALVVTADHGGLDVPATGRLDLDTDPRLAAGVRAVAGEPRVRYLHIEPGATADVVDTWRGLLGEHADVLLREEAVAADLYGPVRPEHLDRLGDVVVVARGDTVVLATAHEPPELAQLVGFHGSTTPAETAIPLITVAG
jgi:hypothetical protein